MIYELFESIKKELEHYDLESVAECAEISPETLRLWMNGKIQKPRIDTLIAVSKVIDMVLVATHPNKYNDTANVKKRHLRIVK